MLDRSRHNRWLFSAVVLALCLMVPACKNRVTRANFDRITPGMTLAEVEAILGKSSSDDSDGSNVAGQFGVTLDTAASSRAGQTYNWEKGNKTISVYFLNGKVQSKKETGL